MCLLWLYTTAGSSEVEASQEGKVTAEVIAKQLYSFVKFSTQAKQRAQQVTIERRLLQL